MQPSSEFVDWDDSEVWSLESIVLSMTANTNHQISEIIQRAQISGLSAFHYRTKVSRALVVFLLQDSVAPVLQVAPRALHTPLSNLRSSRYSMATLHCMQSVRWSWSGKSHCRHWRKAEDSSLRRRNLFENLFSSWAFNGKKSTNISRRRRAMLTQLAKSHEELRSKSHKLEKLSPISL